ncbi:MAG TPA: hypothetical protein VD731_03350 [Nitrosopumilaceae archaeon]|nr:hypothetical protein [Nitrosopumilaceae archaeon]
MKINYKNLGIFLIFATIWLFFGPRILAEHFSFELELRNFISTTAISVLAVVLFVLKRHYGLNPHLVDSMEMLIVGITPTVASFHFLKVDDYGRVLMAVFAVCVTVFWFLYFWFGIKPKEYVDYDENEKEKLFISQTKHITLVVFISLLILEFFMFQSVLTFNTIL